MNIKDKSHMTVSGGMREKGMPSLRLCLLSVIVLLAAFTSAACNNKPPDAKDAGATPSPAALGELNFGFTPRPLTEAGRRTPLTISYKETEGAGYTLRYPYVCDDGMDLLNIAVRAACLDFAQEYGGSANCRLRYNNRGILSFTLYSADEEGAVTAVSSANFDCDTGTRFYISSCFGSGNEDYRFSLADSITDKLAAKGLTPLSYIPPVDDGRLFYISEAGLVLLYRQYELCGAEAGFPEVTFRYNELTKYLNSDSLLLLRLPYFD